MNTRTNQILRCPDDAAGTVSDPLDQDVGEEVKYPLLAPGGTMRFLIQTAEHKVNETTKNEQLVFKSATQAETRSTDGDTLHAGFVSVHRINVKPTEKVTAKRIADDVKIMCQACGVKGKKVSEVIADPSVFVGKLWDAKVGVSASKDPKYSDSNSFRPVPLSQD